VLPPPPLRPGEEEFLSEFRAALQNHGLPVPQDGWIVVRFLRARGKDGKRDIPKSVEMYQKHLAWRQQFGTDSILRTLQFPEKAKVQELHQAGFFNTTRDGHPVYIERLGNLDLKKLFTITTKERMLKYHVYLYEDMLKNKLAACSAMKKSRVCQIFSILDLKGIGMGTLMDSGIQKFLGDTLSLDQDNYPEVLYRMYIINAPGMFSMAWNVISRFLDPNTRAKISIMSGNFLDELTKHVDVDKLPDFVGGKASSASWPNVQPGPWLDWHPVGPASAGDDSCDEIDVRIVEPGQAWQPQVSARSCAHVLGGGLVRAAFRRPNTKDVYAAGDVQAIPEAEDDDDDFDDERCFQVDLGDAVSQIYACHDDHDEDW